MESEAHRILEHARQFLLSAQDNLAHAPPRLAVAFDEARTAAELAGKALLLHRLGTYPRTHAIGGTLAQANLIPAGVDPRRLSRLLRAHTKGEYGYDLAFVEDEVSEAIEMASRLISSAGKSL